MEKFSTWRDGGTGIQPFLPVKPPSQSQDITVQLTHYLNIFILQPVIFLVKLPFLLIFIGLATLSHSLIQMVPNGNFKRGLKTYLLSPQLRLNLFLLGFYNIGFKVETLHKGRSSRNKPSYSKLGDGDIILSNYSSYLDIIYLYQKFQPIFTKSYPNSNKLKIISNEWDLINNCHLPQTFNEKETTYTLDELVKFSKNNNLGPVVIFPEGVTSNGRGLLKFNPILQKLKTLPIINLVILKYKYQNFATTYPCGSKLVHFYKTIVQIYNQLNVQYLDGKELRESFGEQGLIKFEGFVKEKIGEVSRFRQCSIGEVEKVAFLKFFESGGKAKAN
ncbi:hypothetical protein CONCODRAFT_86575 [Conidiobolus coronatus NRRL 28638]|uniref:Phospholipid/glycerol acyltransferase domain-containing protein n=1 Tax=Conidiobolus coronatus (strain ATCC 28846 / CBS 209.66 / NRRL 28638) TaxID=796925 RepID=A0A137NZT2_CONC2|nr:hypothetical protein CONCODRAFT_86575 [Conidiobolus coronatus NRRL 28638]|eukprot:KXN68218.1 hypothetical protein CONCODRAFT_86575 [Conidiobolus coronatus NRRL 28638]